MVTDLIRESASPACRRMRRVVLATALATAMALVLAVAPALAAEGFGLVPGSFTTSATTTQAGAHDDFTTNMAFNSGADGLPIDHVKDIVVDLPPGIVGNPTSAPKCYASQLAPTEAFSCPPDSQVGRINLKFSLMGIPFFTSFPVWNMAQRGLKPAEFGFKVVIPAIFASASVRPDDYGLRTVISNIPTTFPLISSSLTLWGNPPDSSHDSGRGSNCYVLEGELSCSGEGRPSGQSPAAFMRNPTECGVQQTATVTVDSWQDPSDKITATSTLAPMTGCDKLSFNPDISLRSGSRSAGQPTGMTVNLSVPQSGKPDDLGTPDLKKAVVTLPPGITINPAAAGGQQGCAPAQIGIGSNEPPTCPESSQLGTVKIKTPVLEEELEGAVYLAKEKENPFGSLIALYLAVKGPGFYLKLPGKVDLDQSTGQITTTFENTPQLPFEELHLSLRGGPRAPLITPSTCGTYSTKAVLTSWSSSTPVELESPITIDQGCANGGFSPGLQAGTADPNGGSFSPFTLRVTRADGQQNISSIEAKLPKGLLAKLAGIPTCGDAQAATGDCPAASQVGTTTVGAGAGSNPVFVPEAGKAPTAVYLAGPYKGAPYSLVVKVPAQAGPFDLGTVAVRNGLYIDPETTQVTTKSDPLPQILQGIPVAYRDVRVEVNRPGFTVNPTNCAPMSVDTTIGGSGGATASPSVPFRAANCERLGFAPKLALRLSGAPPRRGGNPALQATVTPAAGNANIGKASVILPGTELLEQGHIKTVCTRVQFAAGQCPAGSIYGHAKAWTPLLDTPLEGPVYLRSNGGERKLPDLVADLNGSIHVVLVGYIDSVKRHGSPRIRTRFLSVPDAPVSRFVLEMQRGKKSLLANTTNLCKAKPRAEATLGGQNGKGYETRPLVKVSGCGGKAHKKSKAHTTGE
jgi:hypothetical protein